MTFMERSANHGSENNREAGELKLSGFFYGKEEKEDQVEERGFNGWRQVKSKPARVDNSKTII